MRAYYNEFDPYAADWLENLIQAGHIAPGDVDRRSIVDVSPADLAGYTQVHFFAGIGGWSLAARLAGWPDDRPLWTGSCPCQPFSAAGKRGGFADERHLWPVFHQLIEACQPEVVMGEQVASKDGLHWLGAVFADLEGAGYLADAVDLCAAGVGAPHIRQRLWWVGERVDDAASARRVGPVAGAEGAALDEARLRMSGEGRGARRLADAERGGWPEGRTRAEGGLSVTNGGAGRLADADADGRSGIASARVHGRREGEGRAEATAGGADGARGDDPARRGEHGRLADAAGSRWSARVGHVGAARDELHDEGRGQADDRRPRPPDGFWRDVDWLFCRDGKWRPVEPGTFPLAHGVPGRVGRLRAYGNAIVPQVAAEVIRAFMEAGE